MDTALFLRSVAVWLAVASAETLHGIARVRFLNPRVGDVRARRIGVASGSLIILGIALVSAPWIAARGTLQWLAVGLVWLALMLAFDIGLGRWVFHLSWQRISADFNPLEGGWLAAGMAFLAAAPLIAAKILGLP